jgi:hypothetical protein
MRAARIGTITFSIAVRLATRLKAWNTIAHGVAPSD